MIRVGEVVLDVRMRELMYQRSTIYRSAFGFRLMRNRVAIHIFVNTSCDTWESRSTLEALGINREHDTQLDSSLQFRSDPAKIPRGY
jgi:hypothetical protein